MVVTMVVVVVGSVLVGAGILWWLVVMILFLRSNMIRVSRLLLLNKCSFTTLVVLLAGSMCVVVRFVCSFKFKDVLFPFGLEETRRVRKLRVCLCTECVHPSSARYVFRCRFLPACFACHLRRRILQACIIVKISGPVNVGAAQRKK